MTDFVNMDKKATHYRIIQVECALSNLQVLEENCVVSLIVTFSVRPFFDASHFRQISFDIPLSTKCSSISGRCHANCTRVSLIFFCRTIKTTFVVFRRLWQPCLPSSIDRKTEKCVFVQILFSTHLKLFFSLFL